MRPKQIFRNQEGATLVYVAALSGVMLGVVGLSYDLGRHYILSTELQKAADAAATAGAFQLDPNGAPATVTAKVTAAVQNAPVTANSSRLATSNGIIDITPSSIRLHSSVPADDDDPIPVSMEVPPYNYVTVTTEAKVSNNVFGRLVGQPANVTLSATATARRGRAICQITPLAICNPEEAGTGNAGAAFNVNDYLGTQILVRAIGNGNQAWAPGNFGFLNSPGFGGGAPGLFESLATASPANCFNATVTTEPGQTNGARNALNTRFGIYQNPQPGGVDGENVFPPAANVYKGFNTQDPNHCSSPAPNAAFRKLGRDTDLSDSNRFGNGEWDCLDYWSVTHPSDPAPAGCADSTTNSVTRWEVYRYENENGYVSNTTSSTEERGTPVCNGAGNPPVPYDPLNLADDRRVVTMAVLNCLDNGVSGRWTGPAEGFINGFLTEPVVDGDMVFEVIGGSAPGAGGPVAVKQRDWVEIVR